MFKEFHREQGNEPVRQLTFHSLVFVESAASFEVVESEDVLKFLFGEDD